MRKNLEIPADPGSNPGRAIGFERPKKSKIFGLLALRGKTSEILAELLDSNVLKNQRFLVSSL
jgi:hypothetical protein